MVARGLGPQGLQLAGVAQQQLAGLGQPQRTRADHQQPAQSRLQRTQALRHRRLRDGQAHSGAVKPAFVGQRGQRLDLVLMREQRRITQRRVLAGGRSAIVRGLPSGPMTYFTRGRIISVIGLSIQTQDHTPAY